MREIFWVRPCRLPWGCTFALLWFDYSCKSKKLLKRHFFHQEDLGWIQDVDQNWRFGSKPSDMMKVGGNGMQSNGENDKHGNPKDYKDKDWRRYPPSKGKSTIKTFGKGTHIWCTNHKARTAYSSDRCNRIKHSWKFIVTNKISQILSSPRFSKQPILYFLSLTMTLNLI